MGSGFPSLKPPVPVVSTNVNAVYGQSRKCFSASKLTFVYGRLRSCTLRGVECQHSPGAKHRSCSGTKLKRGSCLQHPHRSRGLRPGCLLLSRLLRRVFRVLARPSTYAQRGSNLLGLGCLEKVLKAAVFR